MEENETDQLNEEREDDLMDAHVAEAMAEVDEGIKLADDLINALTADNEKLKAMLKETVEFIDDGSPPVKNMLYEPQSSKLRKRAAKLDREHDLGKRIRAVIK